MVVTIRNISISVVIILLSGILFYDTFSIEAVESDVIGPTTWPRLLLAFLFVFGVILFFQSIYQLKKASKDTSEVQIDLVKFWSSLIIIILYIPTLIYLGFMIATPLCIVLLSLIAGMRKILPLILTPLIGTAIVTLIFPILLQISLPRGVGVMREISYLFY